LDDALQQRGQQQAASGVLVASPHSILLHVSRLADPSITNANALHLPTHRQTLCVVIALQAHHRPSTLPTAGVAPPQPLPGCHGRHGCLGLGLHVLSHPPAGASVAAGCAAGQWVTAPGQAAGTTTGGFSCVCVCVV